MSADITSITFAINYEPLPIMYTYVWVSNIERRLVPYRTLFFNYKLFGGIVIRANNYAYKQSRRAKKITS